MKKGTIFLSVFSLVCLACAADPGRAEEVIDLKPIVVTAARMEQETGEYGADVVVLGKKEIAASGALNTAEFLGSVPGVYLTRKSTSRTAVVDLRGFGDTSDRNVLILLNGRKINSVDNSGVNLSAIPLENIERVEIVRGAGSVLYGDHAVGGVINIITQKGRGRPSGETGISFGSYGARKAFLESGGSGQKVSYFISAQTAEDKGYRSNSDVSAKDGNVSVGFRPSARLSFDWDIRWHEDHYGLPGGLNAAGLKTYGRRGSDEEENYGDTTERTFGFVTTYRPWGDPQINAEITVDYAFRNQDSYGWYDYGVWGASATRREIDTHALLTKYTHTGEIGDHHWNAVIGTDVYDVTSDILGSGTGIMISTDNLTISKEELGVYGYGEFELVPKLFAGAGLRYQQADYTFDQRSGTPSYTEKDPSETVKKGLLRYEYAEGSNVYASVEETFRFLSTDEWYSTYTGLDATLKHQTGVQYELGWRHDFDRRAQVSVVPYWIENENEIFLDPSVSPGYNKNYDRTLRRGVEVSGSFDLLTAFDCGRLTQLRLNADYNYQRAEFRDGAYAGSDVPMAPRHQAGLTLSARWKNGWGISLTERAVGSRYVINDTLNSMPKEKAYVLTDFKVSWVKADWEVFAAVNNLFGRKYNDYAAQSTGGSTNIEFYPAPERNFEAGVKVKF